jgi:hypothetical protein
MEKPGRARSCTLEGADALNEHKEEFAKILRMKKSKPIKLP